MLNLFGQELDSRKTTYDSNGVETVERRDQRPTQQPPTTKTAKKKYIYIYICVFSYVPRGSTAFLLYLWPIFFFVSWLVGLGFVALVVILCVFQPQEDLEVATPY